MPGTAKVMAIPTVFMAISPDMSLCATFVTIRIFINRHLGVLADHGFEDNVSIAHKQVELSRSRTKWPRRPGLPRYDAGD